MSGAVLWVMKAERAGAPSWAVLVRCVRGRRKGPHGSRPVLEKKKGGKGGVARPPAGQRRKGRKGVGLIQLG